MCRHKATALACQQATAVAARAARARQGIIDKVQPITTMPMHVQCFSLRGFVCISRMLCALLSYALLCMRWRSAQTDLQPGVPIGALIAMLQHIQHHMHTYVDSPHASALQPNRPAMPSFDPAVLESNFTNGWSCAFCDGCSMASTEVCLFALCGWTEFICVCVRAVTRWPAQQPRVRHGPKCSCAFKPLRLLVCCNRCDKAQFDGQLSQRHRFHVALPVLLQVCQRCGKPRIDVAPKAVPEHKVWLAAPQRRVPNCFTATRARRFCAHRSQTLRHQHTASSAALLARSQRYKVNGACSIAQGLPSLMPEDCLASTLPISGAGRARDVHRRRAQLRHGQELAAPLRHLRRPGHRGAKRALRDHAQPTQAAAGAGAHGGQWRRGGPADPCGEPHIMCAAVPVFSCFGAVPCLKQACVPSCDINAVFV